MTTEPIAGHFLSRPISRRQVLRTSLAAGGALTFPAIISRRGAFAQEATPVYTKNASITSWGFGTEPTNPMAFGRVDAFNKAFPNIKITFTPQWDDQKLLTAAASKQLPDLIWMGRNVVSSWAARNVLMPLDDFIKKAGIDTSVFYPAAVKEVTYNGKMYGMPQFMVINGLYVNNDQLKEIGVDGTKLDTSNWDGLSADGAKLVQKSGATVTRWGFDHKIQAATIWLWGVANGGSFMSEDFKKATFNDPKNVAALDWGVKAYEDQGGYKAYQAISTTWQGDMQFAQAKVAMTVYESWMLGIIAQTSPKLNFTLLPIKKNGQDVPYSTSTGSAWVIPQNSPNPEAAWAFIQFMNLNSTWMAGAEAKVKYQESKGGPYIPDLTGNKIVDQMELSQLYKPIAPQFDAAVKTFTQVIQEHSENWQIANSPVSNQLQDIMTRDGTTPALSKEATAKDALDKANQDAQDAIDSFQP